MSETNMPPELGDIKKHPIQPVGRDGHGTWRFKENAIVNYLLDKGPFDMNHLAMQDFPREDREQFAQLIGYSLSGFGDLSYAADDTYEAADRMATEGLDEAKARVEHLEFLLREARKDLKPLCALLFPVAEEDLEE